MAVALILVEQFLLRVAGFGFELLDLGIDVAVADEDVGPAVVIHIEEAATPAEKLCVAAEPAGERGVFKTGVADVVVEGRCVAGEIGFDDVEIAVEIVIGGGDAHAGLGLTVGAEGAASFHGNVDKFSIVLVLVKGAGGGVIGDVNVGPAVVVEIGGEDAEAVGAVGVEDASFFGDVGETAVAIVVIEDVLAAVEAGR